MAAENKFEEDGQRVNPNNLTVNDMILNMLQRLAPITYFTFYQEISWGLATNHSWTSVFGPCNQTQDKPDFGIDFWHYGGYNNDYSFTWKIRVNHTRLD